MINYSSCATQNAINEVILEHNGVSIASTDIVVSQSGIGYTGISTVGTAYTCPTESDLETKVEAKLNSERWKTVRIRRDRQLTETDWVVTKASEGGVGVSTAWKNYRQALRDIPTQNIDSITWPTKPE